VSDADKISAQDLYLKGRFEWNKRTLTSLNSALDLFTQAIVHDPGNAQAYAGLADTYDLLWEYSTMREDEAFPRAIAAAKKAVQLDDTLAEAHRALAFAEMYGTWDFVDAEKEFRRAIELDPKDAQARRWFANAFAVPSRYDEALKQINKAQELDPSSNATLADKGLLLANAGHTKEGTDLLKEVERSSPEFRSPHIYMMRISLADGNYQAFLSEGASAAESANDAVLRDIISSAQTGYKRAGGRGLLQELYAKQKEYYLAHKLSGTWLAKTCSDGSERGGTPPTRNGLCESRKRGSELPVAPGFAVAKKRATVQSPGGRDAVPDAPRRLSSLVVRYRKFAFGCSHPALLISLLFFDTTRQGPASHPKILTANLPLGRSMAKWV
jgi:tetratricopeptide (TPR) repeat protein